MENKLLILEYLWKNKQYQFSKPGQEPCTFKKLPLAVEVKYLGNIVGDKHLGSVDDCIKKCKEIKECQNFVYAKHKKECYLKDGILTGSEPVRAWTQQFSVYKSCNQPSKAEKGNQMLITREKSVLYLS